LVEWGRSRTYGGVGDESLREQGFLPTSPDKVKNHEEV
jgi:hypothetical protein